MTEAEYLLIRQMENDHRDVLRRISNLENPQASQELTLLHSDLISIIETLQDTINNKKVKSMRALDVLNQMKIGFIEMLAQVETLMS